MPAHPVHACYCHVIEAGHGNLVRLIQAGDVQAAMLELKHLKEVTGILNDYLLYAPHDPRWSDREHDRYWDIIRPAYLREASPESVLAYSIAWEFLALTTRFDFMDIVTEEARRLRRQLDS